MSHRASTNRNPARPRRAGALTAGLAADLDATFPDVVAAFQDGIYSTVLRMTRSRDDAADVTQETFLRAYQALAGYTSDRIRSMRMRGWLWTIALNLCRNRARSRSRRPQTVDADEIHLPASNDVGPEDAALSGDLRVRLAAALHALPDRQREAVVLRHIADLPYAEIAAAVDRPVGTVKADVHRGVVRLRSILNTRKETAI